LTDRLTTAERSALMARVRSSGTTPEMRVRRIAHALGLRYRVAPRGLTGTPDLCFSGAKVAVFVHGCFWHRHSGCRKASMPASNVELWRAKFEANRSRDLRVERRLRAEGWTVLVIWECETKDAALVHERLAPVVEHYVRRRAPPLLG
jgi:DNA mismatch endonuclease, patch repair protein